MSAAVLVAIAIAIGLAAVPSLCGQIDRLVADRVVGAAAHVSRTRVAVSIVAALAVTTMAIGWTGELAAYTFLAAVLVVLSFVDLATLTLPRRVVQVALVAGIALLVPVALVRGEPDRLWWGAVGVGVAFATLTLLHLVARGGFGYGDVRLGAALGWYLGWQGLRYLPVALFTAFLLSGVVGTALLATGRVGRRSKVPFGPFLAGGAILALAVGPSG